jgi:tRNA pseudouridine38-40 synthase
MTTFRVTLAYDGTDLVGWQRQASGTSVQGLLEDAARTLDGRDVTVIGAGRTDAGVHALGQVAAFTLARTIAAASVVRALNARLPETVRVLDAVEVPASFHPQFDARAKTYRYRMWNADAMSPFERRFAWHLPGRLDVAAMCAAATLVEGEHDFAAFQGTGSDVATTVRRVAASVITTGDSRLSAATRWAHGNTHGLPVSPVDRDRAGEHGGDPLICYEVTGTGFLRHMVRAIVGSLVEIGRGRQPVEWMSRVIASRDRCAAGQTAPAAGLFLVGVDYRPPLAEA